MGDRCRLGPEFAGTFWRVNVCELTAALGESLSDPCWLYEVNCLAMRLNAPSVASGCEGHARKGRFVNFCITSLQTWTSRALPLQWDVRTSARILLLALQHWTSFRLSISLPGIPGVVVEVTTDGMNAYPTIQAKESSVKR